MAYEPEFQCATGSAFHESNSYLFCCYFLCFLNISYGHGLRSGMLRSKSLRLHFGYKVWYAFLGQSSNTLLLFLKSFKKTVILIDIKVVRIHFQSVMYSEVCLTDWILCRLRFFLIRISLLIEFFYFFYVTMHSEVYFIQLWLL